MEGGITDDGGHKNKECGVFVLARGRRLGREVSVQASGL